MTRNLADPETRLDRIFKELGDAAGEVAPVAEQQAALFVNLDSTFAALATVARPFLQETISESPPTLETGTEEFPKQRAFLRNSTAFARELRPGIRTLPASAPVLADALEFGTQTLPKTPPFNRAAGRRVRLAGRVRRGSAGSERRPPPARDRPVAAADDRTSSRPPRRSATT